MQVFILDRFGSKDKRIVKRITKFLSLSPPNPIPPSHPNPIDLVITSIKNTSTSHRIVRLDITVSPEDRQNIVMPEIHKLLKSCHWYQINITQNSHTRSQTRQPLEGIGPSQLLDRYLDAKGFDRDYQATLAKAGREILKDEGILF